MICVLDIVWVSVQCLHKKTSSAVPESCTHHLNMNKVYYLFFLSLLYLYYPWSLPNRYTLPPYFSFFFPPSSLCFLPFYLFPSLIFPLLFYSLSSLIFTLFSSLLFSCLLWITYNYRESSCIQFNRILKSRKILPFFNQLMLILWLGW